MQDRFCYRPVGFPVNAESPERQMRKVADDAPLMERVEYMLQCRSTRNLLVTVVAFR